MSEVNPRWQSTGEETDARTIPVRVSAPGQASARVRIGAGTASRLPGASVGIVLMLIVGILLSRSGGELWSDLLSLPAQLLVAAKNSTSSSASFASSEGTTTAATDATPPSSAAPDATGESPPATGADIPRNPYTVDSGLSRPLDSTGQPLDGQETPSATPGSLLHAGAPPGQPQSGPEIWFILLLSLATMAWISRTMLFPVRHVLAFNALPESSRPIPPQEP